MSLRYIDVVDGLEVDRTVEMSAREQAAIQARRDAEAVAVANPPLSEDEQLEKILLKHKSLYCGCCGHRIGWGDIAWNNGNTEYGTDYTVVEIQCVGCENEIIQFRSWSWVESNQDLPKVLDEDWGSRA